MMSVNIANGLAKNGIESYLCATRAEGHLKEKLKPTVQYLFLNKKSTIDISAVLIALIKGDEITRSNLGSRMDSSSACERPTSDKGESV